MAVTPEQLADTLLRRSQAKLAALAERAETLRARVEAWARTGVTAGDFEAAWLIGSLASGTWGEGSDVDVVVQGLRVPEGQAWDSVSDTLGLDVDLLRLEELPAGFAQRVRSEGVRLA